MSLLEDRLLRIIELRQAGKSHAAIARTLHIPKKSIVQYERFVKASLQEGVQEGVSTLGELASKLKMSRTVTGMAMEYFGLKIHEEGLKIPEKSSTEKIPTTKFFINEETRQRLQDAAATSSTREEVFEKMKIAKSTVKSYACRAGITLPHSTAYQERQLRKKELIHTLQEQATLRASLRAASLEEKGQKIKELVEQGKSLQDIAVEIGLSPGYLRILAKAHGIPLATRGRGHSPLKYVAVREKLTTAERAQIIQKSLAEGERSLEELVKKAKTGLNTFHQVCTTYRITLPEDIIPYRYRPDLDTLIDKGFNIVEIADRYSQQTGKGYTRQAVEQYLARSGQKPYWEQKKEERKEREAIPAQLEEQKRQEMMQALKVHLIGLARKEGWVYEKAVECMYTRTRSFTPKDFQGVLELLQRYDSARQRGEKVSIEKLGEQSGWHQTEVSKILRELKVPTLCRIQYRPSKAVVALKKERIVAVVKAGLPLNAIDIEYFTKIQASSVHAYIQGAGLTSNVKRNGIKRFGFGKKIEQLDYRTASQLYEANDAGFLQEQIQEYAGSTSEDLIRYAFKHRNDIEHFITLALQILFPEENITKPYRDNTQSLDEVLLREIDPVYRAYRHLSWNSGEVAYFLEMDTRGVHSTYQHLGGRKKESKDKEIVKSDSKGSGHLNLRIASQIYQLQDERVSEKKIAKELHLKLAVIEYAKEHRREYEQEIVQGLKIMFPLEKITKPYR